MLDDRRKEEIDYLAELGLGRDETLMIINPLDTAEQAQKLLRWIKQHSDVHWGEMRRQAKRIVEKN